MLDVLVFPFGHICPLSTTYQATHGAGVRAAIEEMAPGLIGEDPTQTDRINATMNKWMMGAKYAKPTIDIAGILLYTPKGKSRSLAEGASGISKRSRTRVSLWSPLPNYAYSLIMAPLSTSI